MASKREPVYSLDGDVIGYAYRESKIARASATSAHPHGKRRPFYTACVVHPLTGENIGPSLGTRHETFESAERAIRLFHVSDFGALMRMRYWPVTDLGTCGQMVAAWKYDHWRDCALSERNLPMPTLRKAS